MEKLYQFSIGQLHAQQTYKNLANQWSPLMRFGSQPKISSWSDKTLANSVLIFQSLGGLIMKSVNTAKLKSERL